MSKKKKKNKIDNMRKVLSKYESTLFKIAPPLRQSLGGSKLQHVCWMCYMVEYLIQEGEWAVANRWFGLIQGVLWAENIFTLEEISEDNKLMNLPGYRVK